MNHQKALMELLRRSTEHGQQDIVRSEGYNYGIACCLTDLTVEQFTKIDTLLTAVIAECADRAEARLCPPIGMSR